MKPKNASKKTSEREVSKNTKDKCKTRKGIFRMGDSFKTKNLGSIFSKGDNANWSYELHRMSIFMGDTMPS